MELAVAVQTLAGRGRCGREGGCGAGNGGEGGGGAGGGGEDGGADRSGVEGGGGVKDCHSLPSLCNAAATGRMSIESSCDWGGRVGEQCAAVARAGRAHRTLQVDASGELLEARRSKRHY